MNKFLNEVVRDIIQNKGQKRAVLALEEKLKEGFPPTCSKEVLLKELQNFIDEKIKHDPQQALVDLATFTSRSPVKLTKHKRENLKKVYKLISDAKPAKCKHKNLGIAPFFHGGGFSPVFNYVPELICTDCGLNVSLWNSRTSKQLGLKFRRPVSIKTLNEWSTNLDPGKANIQSANNILDDPIAAFESSVTKWDKKPFPIEVVYHKKLESFSGI